MSMTDPISDMLTRIRNAVYAGHRALEMPASKVKERLIQILKDEGYIEDFELKKDGPQGLIHVDLKWHGTQSAIEGLRRVSKPGQRRYAKSADIPKVRNGLGIMIISTPRGMMTDRAARRHGIGGELICSVW